MTKLCSELASFQMMVYKKEGAESLLQGKSRSYVNCVCRCVWVWM